MTHLDNCFDKSSNDQIRPCYYSTHNLRQCWMSDLTRILYYELWTKFWTVGDMCGHYNGRLSTLQVHVMRLKQNVLSIASADKVWNLLNADTQVLVTVLRCSQRRVVSAMTETCQIPHLSVGLDSCLSHTPEKFTLHLTQDYTNMAAALIDILKSTGQHSISIDMSHGLDLIPLQALLVQLSSLGASAVVMNTQRNNRNQSMSWQRGIFIIVENNLKATKVSPQWTGVTLTGHLPQPCARQLSANPSDVLLLDIRPKWPADSEEMYVSRNSTVLQGLVAKAALMVVTTTDHEEDKDSKTSPYGFCSKQQRRPCRGSDSPLFEELKAICRADVSNRCGRQIMPEEYSIFDVSDCSGRRLPIGEWTKSKGLALHTQSQSLANSLFINKLDDFGGIMLRVGIHPDTPPHVSRKSSSNSSLHGIVIDMLDDLAEVLNFKYILMEPEDGWFGSKLSNGSWAGVVGMVAREEVDFAAGPFSINKERSEVVDFITPFMQESFGILAPRPKEARKLFQVFQPFDQFIWIALLLSVLLACVVFATIGLVTAAHTNGRKRKHELLEMSVKENVLLIISSYFEQGPTFHPTSVSARCFLSFWFVFTILTMTMYTAHLAAVLTVSTPLRPINSLRDLVDQNDLKIVIREGGSTYSLFTQSKKPLYKAVASRFKAVRNFTDAIRDVRDGKTAVLADRSILDYMASHSCREARVAEAKITGFSSGFIVPRHSPYKEAIDLKIQKMVESGLIQKLNRKWKSPSLNCTTTDSSGKVRRLTLESLGGLFIVLGVVTLVAMCSFLVEQTMQQCRPFCTR